ncbi:flagellar assembly protein FliH [Alkalicoccobacillus murimartini]|uniref:Flagellar assembly protein FliH n=1 Tax=Alkalicoccobacillus murimartini TaxID=171685 RepID=A0ABT9YET2_9BACI|nr:flagellar assembly protein FliH [Alkalicoccobacillus murimartini]MDQ0206345.1 flagellar assembly protein FliH [Alkalicoccobacillus murimartini]
MSRIIKSHSETKLTTQRMITIKPMQLQQQEFSYSPVEDDHSTQLKAERRLQDMEKQAQQMMDEAELQSEQLTELFERKEEELSRQAEQLFEEHRTKGYDEGYKEAEQVVWATYSDKILEAQDILQQAELQRADLMAQAEPQMIKLAYLLAEKILGQTLDQDENKIQFLKKQVFEAREHEDLKLFVHPNWYQKVLEQKHVLTSILSSTTQMLIIADHQLDEKACLIETKQGRLHASVDEQLTSIKEQLLQKQKELSNDQSSSS